MPIRLLTQNIINRIAAGEVIERPASVIKELVENAIDANATEVTVSIMDAGKSFISVSDNGIGMDKESLKLCVLSHATSKLDSENLFDIHTFGFRGEALPSIASIARVSIISSPKKSENDSDSENCWKIQLEGTQIKNLSPENRSQGTTVEVRDLFFATPARLKFLKSNFSESENCREAFLRIAAAFPNITLKFTEDGKQKLYFQQTDSLQKRISDVFGENFSRNTFPIDVKKGNLRIHGAIGVPTYNRSTSNQQYFFVNNRCVKDKIFFSALRSAYSGLVPQGRYAVAVLFLEIPYNEVDVNAHPSKIEVRFRDTDTVRCFISSELKNKLFEYGSNHPSSEAVDVFHAKTGILQKQDSPLHENFHTHRNSGKNYNDSLREFLGQSTGSQKSAPIRNENYVDFARGFENSISPVAVGLQAQNPEIFSDSSKIDEHFNATLYDFKKSITDNAETESVDFSEKIVLGDALFQIHNTYIVASDGENLIIVDQHAAAERITLEKLKSQGKLDSQMLLIPERLEMSQASVELIEKNQDLLEKFGIFYEKVSEIALSVTSVASIIENCDVKSLMRDIVDELKNFGEAYSLEEKIHLTLSAISCHGSLRAGKKLSREEMNSLLRQMEDTPNIAQCCHGRPSYVKYSYKILDKFFERH